MMDPQMLMAMLSAMGSGMQAGAPSTNPASGNFLNVMGAALGGGAKGYAAGDEMRRSQEYLKAMQLAMQRKAQEAGGDPAAIADAMQRFDPRNQYNLLQPGQKPSLAGQMHRQPNWWDMY